MFWAGGCASCHAAPGSSGEAKLLLGGGLQLITEFGTFRPPNISPHMTFGIGNWTAKEFANAMRKGISPSGSHYYPSFPFTSYARMRGRDVADLWRYLKTLPPVARKNIANNISFAVRSRRSAALWKRLYFKPGKVTSFANASAEILRGQYLVEGPGHCGECHTPRNSFGGFDNSRWLAGGKTPEGEAPNITPHSAGISGWSVEDILKSLEPTANHTGTSPMEDVRQNMAKLSGDDRMAIAAYLLAVPAVK